MATKSSRGVKQYKGDDSKFIAACDKAGIKATHRQWRKWVNKRGSAYANRTTN